MQQQDKSFQVYSNDKIKSTRKTKDLGFVVLIELTLLAINDDDNDDDQDGGGGVMSPVYQRA